jgi:N-acetyl-D-muramate 6-phosphate phosphatase
MALDLARIKAICFDVDGTLSDTDDQWVSALGERLKPLRGLFPNGDTRPFARRFLMWAETPGNLAYNLLDRMNLDDEAARLYSFLRRRGMGKKPGNFWLVNGVGKTLSILAQRFPLAVVSARDQAGTQAFLNQFQLTGHFRAVATALTCQYTKPFPDPILWAAAQMGVSPQNCLMVGDTTVDIKAGKAAGAQTVGVLCGFGTENELRRAGADLIIPITSALVDVIGAFPPISPGKPDLPEKVESG